jgi:hypothetical protein
MIFLKGIFQDRQWAENSIMGGCLAGGTTISATIFISLYHRVMKERFGCRCVNWGSSKYRILKNLN